MANRQNNRKYVRNLTRAQVVLRFQGSNDRRAVLMPRGQRGDLHPITVSELNQLPDNGVLYEILTETEGKDVLSKQTNNQQAHHPAINILKNAKGENYEKAVVMATKEEAQGTVVARVESNDPEKGNKKNITVEPLKYVEAPEQVSVPGSAGYEPQATNEQGVGIPEVPEIKAIKVEPPKRTK